MIPLKVMLITLVGIDDINQRSLYSDLMRFFVSKGHFVTIVSPIERRHSIATHIKEGDNYSILRVKSLNIQKTNVVEKGIGTFLVDYQLKNAIANYTGSHKFDLILYSTPPITLVHTIRYLKNTHGAKTYMLLKDIFPQNAVDLDMMKKGSILYNIFRKKEITLYNLTDKIGCMSQANVDYLLRENPQIDPNKVEICPNSIEVRSKVGTTNTIKIRNSFGIEKEKKVFIYGGNLGKAQGIDFLMEVLHNQKDNKKAFFIIIGAGTAYDKLDKWFKLNKPNNAILLSQLPKDEYLDLVSIANVGMIFLNYRFTIPNYPSRLLAYLENKIPVLAVTDHSTDVGSNAEKRGYGIWAPSNNITLVNKAIDFYCMASDEKLTNMGDIGYNYLLDYYSVNITYDIIMNSYLGTTNM